jgi:hypothetical protein
MLHLLLLLLLNAAAAAAAATTTAAAATVAAKISTVWCFCWDERTSVCPYAIVRE